MLISSCLSVIGPCHARPSFSELRFGGLSERSLPRSLSEGGIAGARPRRSTSAGRWPRVRPRTSPKRRSRRPRARRAHHLSERDHLHRARRRSARSRPEVARHGDSPRPVSDENRRDSRGPRCFCGLAECATNDTTNSLFERADAGLYAAKRQGKNRAVSEAQVA